MYLLIFNIEILTDDKFDCNTDLMVKMYKKAVYENIGKFIVTKFTSLSDLDPEAHFFKSIN